MAIGFDPTNPGRQRRPSFFTDDDGIGGAINAGQGNTLKSPPSFGNVQGSVRSSAAPAGGSDASGAMSAGARFRQKEQSAIDNGYRFFNGASTAGTAAVNALTYPARKVVGTIVDFDRGFAGMPPRANAGQATSGFDAPQLSLPDWSRLTTGTPPKTSGGIPATPPTVSPTAANFGNVSSRSASTAAPSLVDQGVTLPDGRKLSYGAMVNGVPTFSDGSSGMPGKPGTIPRTMTQSDVEALGARLNTVPASTFTRPVPAFNSTDSEANIAGIMRSQDSGGRFGTTPAMMADARTAAILTRDPRSTLGRAAMSAERRAATASTVLQRKAALAGLEGLDAAASRGTLSPDALAQTNAEGQNALQRTNLGGLYDIAGQRLRNEGDMARTDLAGQYGIATALARPNAATTLDPDKVNSDAVKLLPQVLGLDPAGQVVDPSTGKPRAPTRTEIEQGLQTARAMLTGQSTSSASATPYPEGTRLNGKDGKVYVVKNGLPVLAQ